VPKETPLLFSAAMVRALLDGRKTMTRRIVKCSLDLKSRCTNEDFRRASPHPLSVDTGGLAHYFLQEDGTPVGVPCPYGGIGDFLWVRESAWFDRAPMDELRGTRCFFKGDEVRFQNGDIGRAPFLCTEEMLNLNSSLKKRPSIHMPRWASRITLEITDVRAERLQDISDDDAKSQGVYPTGTGLFMRGQFVTEFKALWSTINGLDSWDNNPWVWVISFKRV
jgi:hypothetical protein